MTKLFGHLVNQFNDFFKNLTPVRRFSIAAASATVVAAIGVVLFLVSGSNYLVLLKDISTENMPMVIGELQKRSIPFKMGGDGRSILVPQEMLHSAQMAMMTDLATDKIGSVGLELFEKQDFGVTSYAQRVNYQRALQGELMRSINTLSSVKQSKVILALPPKKTFLEEGGKASASVVLGLHAGKRLTAEQVRGIAFLVSSAVETLEPESVTVVDDRGKILSRKYGSDEAASSELLEVKRKLEEDLEQRVESILSKVVGAGKVIARVNASLNPRSITTIEEKVDADGTAVSASTTEEELLDGTRTNPAGVPGARANLPGAEGADQVGFRQNVKKELKTQSFAVPKTVRNIRESAGGVERISVAVLVDGILLTETGEDGELQENWSERSPAQLAKYETIVKNAIGFNAKRGDDVKIENIRFEKEDFAEAERILTSLERKKLVNALFKWSLLGMSLALFFFVVVRPFMRWVTDSFQDSVEEMLPRTIEELEELQSSDNALPGMSGALPVLEDSLDPNKAESELLKERIMALVESDKEKAASAFGLWLARRDQ